MKAHLSPRDLALTLAIVALWDFTFVPIKVGLREMPPFAMAALRFFFAAVPLMAAADAVALYRRLRLCHWRMPVRAALFLGMKLGMPAGLSSLVIQLQVFFTIGLVVVFWTSASTAIT